MYFDETIAASLLVIAGTLVFLVSFGWVVYKDLLKEKKPDTPE